METRETEESEIDLLELWYVIRKKLWLILLTGILLGGVTGVVYKFYVTPMYASKTQLYILNKNQSLESISLSDLQIGSQLTKDYMVLVKSRPVIEQVIENLNLDMEYKDLVNCLEISNPQDTRILEIQVIHSDPYGAKRIVNELAKVSAKRISEIMDVNEPNIVEEGIVCEVPVSPKTARNSLIACVIGMFLCGGIIVVRHLLDDTIKTTEDIEEKLGMATLGCIPIENELNGVDIVARRHSKKRKR